jgi:ribosomal protein L2
MSIMLRLPQMSLKRVLTVGIHKSGGRNHDGKMTMRQIGGGNKQEI